ncbi:MAG TPA: helix-turn-helix domain-containing protein [Gammaproteobacteria bacterium]|nr:helix-turn-helix domain-containing protein [Gammaproteobacteria bacterium]
MVQRAAKDAGATRDRQGGPERGELGNRSLAQIRLGAMTLIRNMGEFSPAAAMFVQDGAEAHEPTRRMGLTREQALDLITQVAQSMGANASYARIIRGAADVFGAEGFEEPGVERILEASGVSRRTFYQFFRNKWEVLGAHHELVSAVWLEVVRLALDFDIPAEEKLRRVVRVYVSAFALAGWFFRVVITEAMRRHSPLAGHHDRFQTSLTDLVHPIVEEAAGHPVSPLMVRCQLGALLGIAIDQGLCPDTDRNRLQQVEEVMFSIMMAPLQELPETAG